MFEQLSLMGCGLMGGSFALALKRAGLVKRVVGYSPSPASTELARTLGVIDVAATSPLRAMAGADLVLIAVPVSATQAMLQAIQPLVTPQMLLMDVGSTKCDVVEAAHQALGEQMSGFVPAHPIAGKEVAGVAHADADLYTGKQVILTPTEQTNPLQLQQASALWTALGCRVVQMSAQAHDAAFAAVSHLPHLLSFAFMNAIASQPQGPDYLSLAGPGFRDFSRIAAGEPKMWSDILLANRTEVLAQSKIFRHQLQALEELMANDNAEALQGLIEQASLTRAQWRMGTTTT